MKECDQYSSLTHSNCISISVLGGIRFSCNSICLAGREFKRVSVCLWFISRQVKLATRTMMTVAMMNTASIVDPMAAKITLLSNPPPPASDEGEVAITAVSGSHNRPVHDRVIQLFI